MAKIGSSTGPLVPGATLSYQIDLEPLEPLGGSLPTRIRQWLVAARGGPQPANLLLDRERSLVDPLPADFRFESLDVADPSTITCITPPVGSSGTIVCEFPDPQSFFPNSIDVFGSIAPEAAPGILSNTATMVYNASLTVVKTSQFFCSAASSWDVEVASSLLVTAEKTVTGDFSLGGAIVYQIVLANGGPLTQDDNPGDEFTDVLPPELELDCSVTDVLSGGGSVGCDEGTNTVVWNGSIPANGTVTLQIGATVVSGTPDLPIENQGFIQFDADGNGTNDSNGTTDDPGTPPAPDPTAFVLGIVSPTAAVPSAGGVALLALALLLAVAALPRLRN